MLVFVSACASSGSSGGNSGRIRTIAQSGFHGQGTPPPPLPEVREEFGTQPKMMAQTGPPPTEATMNYVSVGTGERVVPGSYPHVRYVQTDWKTGAVSHDSWANGTASETIPNTPASYGILSFLDAIPLGSRVELVNPTGNGDAWIFIVDLIAQATP